MIRVVEIGQLQITGNLDTTNIEQGFVRIEGQFTRVETQAETSLGTFNKLGRSAARLGKSLALVGTVGVTALTGLATKSPILAPAFARMQVALLNLSNTAGKVLKPIFDTLADVVIPSITEAITNNEGAIGRFVNVAAQGLTDISNLITGKSDEIENLFPKIGLAATGAALGAKFGLGGMMLGAALGYLAATAVAPTPESIQREEDIGAGVDNIINKFIPGSGGLLPGSNRRLSEFGIVTAGVEVLQGVGGALQAIINYISQELTTKTTKNSEMASPSGVAR